MAHPARPSSMGIAIGRHADKRARFFRRELRVLRHYLQYAIKVYLRTYLPGYPQSFALPCNPTGIRIAQAPARVRGSC